MKEGLGIMEYGSTCSIKYNTIFMFYDIKVKNHKNRGA